MIIDYKMSGGGNLEPYKKLFEHAWKFRYCIKLYAGRIPAAYPTQVRQHGEESAIRAAQSRGYLDPDVTELVGTDLHYSLFESTITKRDVHDPE